MGFPASRPRHRSDGAAPPDAISYVAGHDQLLNEVYILGCQDTWPLIKAYWAAPGILSIYISPYRPINQSYWTIRSFRETSMAHYGPLIPQLGIEPNSILYTVQMGPLFTWVITCKNTQAQSIRPTIHHIGLLMHAFKIYQPIWPINQSYWTILAYFLKQGWPIIEPLRPIPCMPIMVQLIHRPIILIG